MTLYGAIEAGGTKFNCLVAASPSEIIAETRIRTSSPESTIQEVLTFFHPYLKGPRKVKKIGVGSFGPLNLDEASPNFGCITTTTKPGWQHFNILSALQKSMNIPIILETDVNAAALGEMTWGAARGYRDFVYITIGTGIGGGVIIDSKPVHGLLHPELGHILLPHDLNRDPFQGSCPFHQDCFEGLANGPAIQRRWGIPGDSLPPNHPAWDLEATYIASALHTIILILSPQIIILGGGVMHQTQLFPLVREKLVVSLNGYWDSPKMNSDLDSYVVPPGLGDRAGALGALALAMS